jgi:hypothetical protein
MASQVSSFDINDFCEKVIRIFDEDKTRQYSLYDITVVELAKFSFTEREKEQIRIKHDLDHEYFELDSFLKNKASKLYSFDINDFCEKVIRIFDEDQTRRYSLYEITVVELAKFSFTEREKEQIRIKHDLEHEYFELDSFLKNKASLLRCNNYDSDADTTAGDDDN